MSRILKSYEILAKKFESLFTDPESKKQLARIQNSAHTILPTFNLTTTSLRHLKKWFDRLDEINRKIYYRHGNFYSDPASIGLVDDSTRQRVLTQAGQAFLSYKSSLYNDPSRAEYQLIKILYFSGYTHSSTVQRFLKEKRDHMLNVISQFSYSPVYRLFLQKPRLLVIAELIANYQDAIPRLLKLPQQDLLALNDLGESGFKTLCSGTSFLPGLSRLCRRIGNDYTRGEERRLHYIMTMALLDIAQSISPTHASTLVVPPPFSNLLNELDIYTIHSLYTSDIIIWFDGTSYQVSSSLAIPYPTKPEVLSLALQPQAGLPKGTSDAAANDLKRRKKRVAKPTKSTVIIDQIASERSEDFVGDNILYPKHGTQLVRVGHRTGEIISLPDGMVPGSDFYVINDNGDPIEFIEVKSISGNPPVNVSLTRAEYLRACYCAKNNIPYRLILVNLASGQVYEISDFISIIAVMTLSEVIQFTVRVG